MFTKKILLAAVMMGLTSVNVVAADNDYSILLNDSKAADSSLSKEKDRTNEINLLKHNLQKAQLLAEIAKINEKVRVEESNIETEKKIAKLKGEYEQKISKLKANIQKLEDSFNALTNTMTEKVDEEAEKDAAYDELFDGIYVTRTFSINGIKKAQVYFDNTFTTLKAGNAINEKVKIASIKKNGIKLKSIKTDDTKFLSITTMERAYVKSFEALDEGDSSDDDYQEYGNNQNQPAFPQNLMPGPNSMMFGDHRAGTDPASVDAEGTPKDFNSGMWNKK